MAEDLKHVDLVHGARMPKVGYGTGGFSPEDAEAAVAQAIGVGYRLIDTAFNYKNEEGVGRGIAISGAARSDLFVTTKFNREFHGAGLVRDAWAGSIERLGLEYLDLLLIHWPNPGHDRYVEAWKGLKHLLDEGLVRAIGVSNFKEAHLQRLLDETGVIPDVNQVQLNPYFPRDELIEFDKAHGIATEAWSPLGSGKGLLEEPAVVALAEAHGRTPGQIVLRWHLQRGVLVIPKTRSLQRMAENLDVEDFELDDLDMGTVKGLEQDPEGAFDSDRMGH